MDGGRVNAKNSRKTRENPFEKGYENFSTIERHTNRVRRHDARVRTYVYTPVVRPDDCKADLKISFAKLVPAFAVVRVSPLSRPNEIGGFARIRELSIGRPGPRISCATRVGGMYCNTPFEVRGARDRVGGTRRRAFSARVRIVLCSYVRTRALNVITAVIDSQHRTIHM